MFDRPPIIAYHIIFGAYGFWLPNWKVYLHTPDEVQIAMLYVNQNPIEAGLPAQKWSWVRPIHF